MFSLLILPAFLTDGAGFVAEQATPAIACGGEGLPGVAGTAKFAAMKTMTRSAEQFLTNARGTRVGVVLDMRTYQRLRAAEEELAEIRAYDGALPKVRREIAAGQSVSLREYWARRTRQRG